MVDTSDVHVNKGNALSKDDENKLKVGSFIRFCKDPPEDIHHCGIFEWANGVLLSFNTGSNTWSVYSQGMFFECKDEWIDPGFVTFNFLKK